MFKNLVKKIIPLFVLRLNYDLKSAWALLMQYIYDWRIYLAHNGAKLIMNASQIEGKIIAHYHVLEKGISHPAPKECFSLPVVENLIKLIKLYDLQCEIRASQVDVAVEVLKKYSTLAVNQGCLSKSLVNQIDELTRCSGVNPGAIQFCRDKFFEKSDAAFDCFAMSRHSVRDFIDEDVDLEALKEAIKVAQRSPSVCNRQTTKVHILTQKVDIEKHLALQTGNRGFGHKINKLLIIASDINYFEGPRERNQAFTDGGMFGMSLLYALHNKKIGAITLNWAYSEQQDRDLHKLGIVPVNHKVIFFVGVGHLPETFKVAASVRRDIEEVISVV